jgi:hypothetical protein
MPIDISNTIKESTNWTFSKMGLDTVFSNDLYASLLMTILIIIILFILDFNKKNKTWNICKTGLYIYIASFGMLFFHRNKLRYEYSNISSENETSNFINKLRDKNNPNIVYNNDQINVEPVIATSVIPDTISNVKSANNNTRVSESNEDEPPVKVQQVSGGGDNSDVFALYGV